MFTENDIKFRFNCSRSTFEGLRLDTDYVIRISFVLSGRKLGSESYTILSPGKTLSTPEYDHNNKI